TPSSRLSAPPDKNGFTRWDTLDHLKEASAVPWALNIHADHGCLVILQEVLQQIRAIEHHRIAIANGLADVQALTGAIQAEVNGMGAALGQETNVSSDAAGLLGVIADTQLGMIHPHAVRTDEREVGLTRHGRDRLLELPSFLFSGFREAGREHRHAGDTF